MRGHMEFHCPRCGAKPMDPCVTDGRFSDSHEERIEARDAAEWICDTCGEHECECPTAIDELDEANRTRSARLS